MKREDILHIVIEDSTDEIEFLKNLAAMTDVLVERSHPEATYFGEITKHLLGRHEQKDHDPTKKGHRRGQHGQLGRQMRSGTVANREQARRKLYPGKSQVTDALGVAAMYGGAMALGPGAIKYGRNVAHWTKGAKNIKNIPTPVTTQGVRNIKRTRQSAQSGLNQARQRYEQMLAQHRSRPQVFTGDMPTNTVNFGQSGTMPFASRPDFLPALVRR